ncbi:MAG TPA: hypothetical protein VOA87_22925 [Thermoanaerobaculia bacterium]|nr:hypothetical protein [Thermoanaerobaculia bacterium]
MIRRRPLATLLLLTSFTAFQLLSSAPQLHPRCNLLGALEQALEGPAATAVHTQEETAGRSTDDCPVCMVSSLSAILAPGLLVFAPAAHPSAPVMRADSAVQAPFREDLRSRAPPSA